jgi:hypothetical protein
MHQLTRVLAEYVHLRAEAQMLITSAGVRGVGLFFASISRSLLPYEQASFDTYAYLRFLCQPCWPGCGMRG